jgi:hypothetical protein
MKKQLFGTYSLIALSIPVALFTIAPNAQAIGVMRGSTATSSMTTAIGSSISNITNQTGLSSGYTSGVTDFDTYVADTTHANRSWWGFSGTSGIITFNLGASYTLNALALWPFPADSTSAIRGFNLYADTDADPTNLGTSLGSFNAVNALSERVNSQVFNFSATPTQFIQMEITSNAGSSATGLSELAFREATPVPWETDALSVIGTTLLFAGGVWKKRKSIKPLEKE